MIQHLTHCITNNMMIGYGNLLMSLFESFEINHSKFESLKLQTNHYIQPRTLDSLSHHVVNGKTEFLVKKQKKVEKKVDVVVESSEEKEEKEEKEVEVEQEKLEKKGTGKGRGGTKRKSVRLAFKPAEKKQPTPFLNLDDDKSLKKEPAVAKNLFGPEKLSGIGFGDFSSSSNTSEELKDMKKSMAKMEAVQGTILGRLDDMEEILSKLVASTNDLTREMKESVATLSEGQKALRDRLEDMVLENKTDDDDEDGVNIEEVHEDDPTA